MHTWTVKLGQFLCSFMLRTPSWCCFLCERLFQRGVAIRIIFVHRILQYFLITFQRHLEKSKGTIMNTFPSTVSLLWRVLYDCEVLQIFSSLQVNHKETIFKFNTQRQTMVVREFVVSNTPVVPHAGNRPYGRNTQSNVLKMKAHPRFKMLMFDKVFHLL